MTKPPKVLTPAQCRAARALIRWTQERLARAAGLTNSSTLRFFETELRVPRAASIAAIKKALEKAGVEFIPENGGGAGVRLAKRKGRK